MAEEREIAIELLPHLREREIGDGCRRSKIDEEGRGRKEMEAEA